MKKAVLALGVSLGVLSLAACDAQDAPMLEQADAAAPAPVEEVAPEAPDATVVEDMEAEAAASEAVETEAADTDAAVPAEGETTPAQ